MRLVKRINNNAAIGLDGHGKQVVVFGTGVGFPSMPYTLTDLSKIQRTYYNIDERYVSLLNELPEEIISLSTTIVEYGKIAIKRDLNPSLVFTLADHIQFAVTRYQKNLRVPMPLTHEFELDYPKEVEVAAWALRWINQTLSITLPKDEITSIALHFINAQMGVSENNQQTAVEQVLHQMTKTIEEFFHIQIPQKSFDYYRFVSHVKFFVQRKLRNETFLDDNGELFEHMCTEQPEIFRCVKKIEQFLDEFFSEKTNQDELLYLMIHVSRLYHKSCMDN